MEVVLTIRPLIRALSSANGATNILGSVPANWETLCCRGGDGVNFKSSGVANVADMVGAVDIESIRGIMCWLQTLLLLVQR